MKHSIRYFPKDAVSNFRKVPNEIGEQPFNQIINMPNISFIVPLYNQDKFIIPCLNSIINAGMPENTFEIIVWNDGSTDKSEEMTSDYMQSKPNIILYTQPNHGVSYSRNQALLRATGKYVWFVDSDDLVKSSEVQNLLNTALAHDLDMIAFNWESLLPDGRIEPGIHKISDAEPQSGRLVYINNMITMAPWAFLYKRQFLLKYNLTFPENYKTCEDIQFNQKALFLAEKVELSSEVGYVYRHQHQSATKGRGNRVVEDQIRRMKEEIEWFSGKNDLTFLQTIVYRNLREINVWLAWADCSTQWFDEIKNVLEGYEVNNRVNFQAMFIILMKYCPKLVFYTQRWLNKIRRKIS